MVARRMWRETCRLDLMRDTWTDYEALLLSKWLACVRSHPQRSAQAAADLRDVVMVEREELPHPHVDRLERWARPENYSGWLGAPPRDLVERDVIGCKLSDSGASGCIRCSVRAVVLTHNNSLLKAVFPKI